MKRLMWIGFILVIASSASAAPIGFTGEFRLRFRGELDATFIAFPVSGTAQISGGTLSLPAGFLSLSGEQATLAGASPGLTVLEITVVNRPGSFMLTSAATVSCAGTSAGTCRQRGHFSGAMLLAGMLSGFGTVPFSVPLTSETSAGFGSGGNVGTLPATTLDGQQWTTGIVTAASAISGTGQAGTFSSLAPGGGLTLVTPIYVNLQGAPPDLTGIAELQLFFVPEPTTLALLATGAALAGLAGRRRHTRKDGAP